MTPKRKNRPVPRKKPAVAGSGVTVSETVEPHSPLALSGGKQNVEICIVLAVATLCVYSLVLRHPFVNYDDDIYVVNNPQVNTGLSWQNIRWSLTALWAGNWHPITWFSHALDCQLFGLYPGGHHLSSLVLHILNVVLLFLLLNRVTGSKVRSMIVASLFALHPLNVESVAWIAERKNLLCTFFFLLTLGAYGWYARKPGVQRYLCVAGLFLLGLASKPMVITLPFVLLLLDYWPLGRIEKWSKPSSAFPVSQHPFSRLALEKLPLLALSAASAVITIIAQRHLNAVASTSVFPFSWRVANALYSYAMYIGKIFLPRGFAVFYPAMPLSIWQVGLATAFFLAIGFLALKLRSSNPYLMAGALWFLGTLVPVIGLVQVGSQSMADRYTYIPLIGILTALVWAAFDVAQSKKLEAQWPLAAAGVILIVLSAVTWRQLGYWRSSYDLWTQDLNVTESNYVAEENLAVSLVSLDRDDEAMPHFMKALAIKPDDPVALLNVGNNLVQHGRPREAIEKFETVIRTSKDAAQLARAERGLGVAYANLGDPATARENFVKALQLNSTDPTDLYNLSLLETQQGVEKLNREISAHPSAQGYLQLGELLAEERNIPEAQVAFERALQLDPSLAEAKQALHDLKGPEQPLLGR